MHPLVFAQSKIQVPRARAGLIERDELEGRLGEALTRQKLVLLVAPAGFGKTAALSRQLRRLPQGCAAAWVTADKDDDLPRLLSYLIEALEPFDPPWRMAAEALASLAAQASGVREAVRALLNALAATDIRHGVIALDDLHTVADPRVFDFLQLLLDGLPNSWTLAIATRVDPPLALARLRAGRELTEFRQGDLRFDQKEIQRLCNAVGSDDSAAAVQRLDADTGGWAAGLCLSVDATLGPPGLAPAHRRRSRQHLFDYMVSDVLEQMPQELREFLLRCSVLPELTASRCASVSGNARSADLLDDIERRGLFVSVLDGEEITLRLHDLFRDFLDEKLRRQFPDDVPALLQRAADSERDPVRKVHLLMRGGDGSQAEQVLAAFAPALLTAGDSAQVMRLVEQFPQDRRETSPELAYASGLCAWHEFEDPAVVETMSRAVLGFERKGQSVQAQEARIFEAIALLFLGRLEEADSRAQAMRADTGARDTAVLVELFAYWRAGIYGPSAGPAYHLGRMTDLLASDASAQLWHRCMPRLYLMIGRPGIAAAMRRFVDGALAAARDTSEPLQAAATVLDTWLLLWRGNRETACMAIESLKEQSRWLGQPRSLRIPLLSTLVAFSAMRGDKEGVRAGCEALVSNVMTSMVHPDWRTNITVWSGRHATATDDWPSAQRALQAVEGSGGTTAFPRLGIRALEARYALHEGRNEDALRMLRLVAEASADVDRLGFDASVRVCLAVAELRAGSPVAAWNALAPLVATVGATGEVGGVLLSGATMLAELAHARWGAAAPAEGPVVLGRWAELARQWRSGAPATRDAPQGGDERLSAREIEVLQHLAEGQSNKLIARALGLSPHTVKRHVARILDRLDLSSRGQAAGWYARNLAGRPSSGSA